MGVGESMPPFSPVAFRVLHGSGSRLQAPRFRHASGKVVRMELKSGITVLLGFAGLALATTLAVASQQPQPASAVVPKSQPTATKAQPPAKGGPVRTRVSV